MGKPEVGKSEEINSMNDSNSKCNSKQKQIGEKANEHPEWLPEGWDVEIRTRKSGPSMGSMYKCYIDPLNGYKFYSKPEVLRYLETKNDKSCRPKEEKKSTPKEEKKHTPKEEKKRSSREEKKHSSKEEEKRTPKEEEKCNPKGEKKSTDVNCPSNVVVEKSAVEDLPPGWVKEVRIRKNKNGVRKDPFYIDPESGYVFRSKKDVLRYLESGDIGACAYKPTKQTQDGDSITPSPATKRQKLKQSAPTQQPVVAKEIFDKNSLELQDANSSRKGQDANVPSVMMDSTAKKTSGRGGSALLSNDSLRESGKRLCADDLQEKEHVNMTENANDKNHSNHSISKKKVFSVGHRSSPRLARIEQEAVGTSNNLSKDQADFKEQPYRLETDKIEDNKPDSHSNSNKFTNKKAHQIPRRASKRLAETEGGEVSKISPIREETESKRKKSHKVPPITDHHLDKLEDKEMDDEKSEPQLSFAFHYSWSDPSLEFAINALTGVLPPVADSVDKGPTAVSKTDSQKTLIDNVAGRYIPVADSVDKGPTAVAETDSQKTAVDNVTGRSRDSQNNPFDNVKGSDSDRKPDKFKGSGSDRKPQVRSNKSKGKKDLKAPMRLSKRLAGLEPEVLPSERALEYSAKKSCKEESIATVTTTAILTCGTSDHVDAGEATKHNHEASDSLKTEVLVESSSKSEKSYDAVVAIGDERSEAQLPLPFGDSWSDPCLEFAIKTLTGVLPVDAGAAVLPVKTPDVDDPPKTPTGVLPIDAGAVVLPVKTPDVDDPPNKELQGVVTSINEETHSNSNQSQEMKELNMVSQPSKVLLGQPELRTTPTSCETAPKFTTRESFVDEGNKNISMWNLNGEPQHVDAGNAATAPKFTTTESCVDEGNKNISIWNLNGEPQHVDAGNAATAPKFTTTESCVDEGNINTSIWNLNGEPQHVDAGNAATAPKFTTTESCVGEVNINTPIWNLNAEPQYIDARNAAELHSRNINTPTCEETLNGNRQVVQGEFITTEQPLLDSGSGSINRDNSELQFCASLMNSWSDPCLEFAFKTLTGEIPVEENLAIPGCLPEPSNCHERKDGGSTLPEFGSSSFSHSDISFQYDIGVKSIPGQQPSMSSSFPPLDKPNLQAYAEFDPLKRYSQHNNFQRR